MLHNVGLNPTRARVLDFLISMGASINLASVQLRDGELIGDVSVRYAQLAGGSISGKQVAEMIDELPMLAALGPFTENGIEIHDAKELRVKESDRIAALAAGLREWARAWRNFPMECAWKAAPPENCTAPRSIRRRSPHCHGARGGSARRRRRHGRSRRRVRRRFLPSIFRRTRKASRYSEVLTLHVGKLAVPRSPVPHIAFRPF